jgi:hypothetical protein
MNDDEKPDPFNESMHQMLIAASAFFVAAAKVYAEDLPRDAAAWAVMLAAGRVVPGVRLEMAPSGPTVELGYLEGSGEWHKFFSWPQPPQQQAPDSRTIN